MSAIRPLLTIAMLLVLGIFLWTRINTPPLEQLEEAELAMTDAPPLLVEGAPPFEPPPAEAWTGAPAPADRGMLDRVASAAPAAPGGGVAVEAAAPAFSPQDQPATGTITPLDTTAAGEVPDLPPLPSHVPTANYAEPATTAQALAPSAPLASSTTAQAPEEPVAASTIAAQVPELGTQVGPPLDYSSSDVPPAPADTPAGAAPPEVPKLPYGAGDEFAPPTSAFASARVAIDAALDRGDLGEAHLLLSGWYGDRSLTPVEREEVDALLGQLAGTVVYSTEHRLEPPHTIQAGETLESIAQTYQVPWQLLGKINGIAQPTAVQPGQQLKVVRGPFFAVVDAERQELALMVADRYAGRFTVKTEGAAAGEGEWVVTQKQSPMAGGDSAKHVVLQQPGGPAEAATIVLAPASVNPPNASGAIRVSPQDQNDLFDILSVGSKVIVRK